LVHFTTTLYILLPFGIVWGIWVHFPSFGTLHQKIWQPCSRGENRKLFPHRFELPVRFLPFFEHYTNIN
jgi:hypothetical protein